MSARRDNPRTMDCDEVQVRLPLVPGADLLPSEDAAVREHLVACARCRSELGSFVRARRALRSLAPSGEPPRDGSPGGRPAGHRGSPREGSLGHRLLEGSTDATDGFFATLRRDTLNAVRRDARRRSLRRQSHAPARRSLAGMMTAAALFLLGVYLVPMWVPEFPEPSPRFPELSPIVAPAPEHTTRGYVSRFRNVGYGLMGHRQRFPSTLVPLDDAAPGPVSDRDVRAALRLQPETGAGTGPRREPTNR